MRTAFRFVIAIVFLGVVLGGIFGYKFWQTGQMQEQMSQPQPPAEISAVQSQTEQWTPTVKAVGSIVAVNGIDVANEVPGVIQQINFESGDLNRRSQTLSLFIKAYERFSDFYRMLCFFA